MKTIDITSMF